MKKKSKKMNGSDLTLVVYSCVSRTNICPELSLNSYIMSESVYVLFCS